MAKKQPKQIEKGIPFPSNFIKSGHTKLPLEDMEVGDSLNVTDTMKLRSAQVLAALKSSGHFRRYRAAEVEENNQMVVRIWRVS